MEEENKLISRIQRTGNRKAADELIRKYYDEIYTYVYKQMSDKHTAMDVTQNIFISMLKSISTYDNKKAGFRTWLYRIGTNKIIDYFRKNSVERRIIDLGEYDIEDQRMFTIDIENKELLLRLQDYINSLDMKSQQIFRLKIFAEYTFPQIASILSLPESTVKSNYYRLLKIIREEFEDEYY
ncbi:RNA polymerase sigma factor [Paratissierella segnis]|uniref:Sigma-70 family RNA polymerase sigma factor n=1 Tax=Paratissierella segnis TaxID=2763679 RepID=A0A926IKU3_9FIRM|nr:sigma-70 family RNA polymerase sigma factor [Paratissierella segnis]MBC8588871.1 sigma-70 family RNA polymerase sigma factor [Paratissierella segnis]